MSNLLNRLEQRVMPHKDVPICLDLNLITERNEALSRLEAAHRASRREGEERMVGRAPAVAEARAALDDIDSRIRDASIVIRITGVDRATYNGFFLACPPRKAMHDAFLSSKFFMHVARNTGTYVDESGAEHEITIAEWNVIDEKITDGEHDRLAQAVLAVNREAGAADLGFLGAASETTRDSFGTSASPAPSE